MSVNHFVLTAVTALVMSGAVSAKEMPQVAAPVAPAAKTDAQVQSQSASHTLPISMRQANRLSVKGGKIERFVSDPQQLEIKHDAATGSLFIIPITRESATLFVMTDSGQTHSLVLTPSDKLGSRSIEITEKANPALNPIEAFTPALVSEDKVQAVFRDLKRILKKPSRKLKRKAVNADGLKAVPDRFWQVNGLELEHWTLTNPTEEVRPIEESRFWQKDIVAVAVDVATLYPNAKADLWILRRAKENA